MQGGLLLSISYVVASLAQEAWRAAMEVRSAVPEIVPAVLPSRLRDVDPFPTFQADRLLVVILVIGNFLDWLYGPVFFFLDTNMATAPRRELGVPQPRPSHVPRPPAVREATADGASLCGQPRRCLQVGHLNPKRATLTLNPPEALPRASTSPTSNCN
jgi:hypothetical protein